MKPVYPIKNTILILQLNKESLKSFKMIINDFVNDYE